MLDDQYKSWEQHIVLNLAWNIYANGQATPEKA